MLNLAVAEGIAVSVKLDPAGGGSIAAATQRNPGDRNAGLCITARGRDAVVAWGRLMFVLHVVGVASDWEAAGTVSDPDRW